MMKKNSEENSNQKKMEKEIAEKKRYYESIGIPVDRLLHCNGLQMTN